VRLALLAMLCAEDINDAMPLSPLLMLLEGDVVVLLNMLVTFARSLLNVLPLVGLLPPSICGGILGRSLGDIASGSSVNGLARMFDCPESPLTFGTDRSDVFVGL